MDEKKALIIGIDLENDTSQICYYDRKSREMTSVEFADQSLLYENEYSLNVIFSMENPDTQLIRLIKLLLKTTQLFTKCEEIASICVTLGNFQKQWIDRIQHVFEILGYHYVSFITHNEAYAYYAFNMKKEMWSGGTLLLDFNKDGLFSDELHMSRINHTDIITEEFEKHVNKALCPIIQNKEELAYGDEFLTSLAKVLLNGKKIAAIYLTGEYFDTVELPDNFVKFICIHRRVFAGQNLYVKGAGFYAAKGSDIEVRTFAFGGRNMVTTGMDIGANDAGTNCMLPLIIPGTSWYNANKTYEFLLGSSGEIVLRLIPFEEEKEYFCRIKLDGFLMREDRACRIKVTFEAENEFYGYVTITEMGFGEFTHCSGKVIKQKVPLNYNNMQKDSTVHAISFESPMYPMRHMFGITACKGEKAIEPLELRNIDLKLYSLEELAYYMYHNIYILGDELKSDALISFLRQQVKVYKLADAIEIMVKKHAGLSEIVIRILQYSGIYSAQEIKKISSVLETLNTQNVPERLKARADTYLQNHCFVKAIEDYEKILCEKKDPTLTGIFYAKTYHNVGVAYANMFAFRESVDAFEEAFRIGQHEESKKMAQASKILYELSMEDVENQKEQEISAVNEGEQDFQETIRREIETQMDAALYSAEYKHLEQIHMMKQDGMIAEYYSSLEDMLDSWKNKYRKYL